MADNTEEKAQKVQETKKGKKSKTNQEKKFQYCLDPDTHRFKPENSPKNDKVTAMYSFGLVRLKSNLTMQERLIITAYQNDECVGQVEGKYTELLDILLNLTDYGVVLSHRVFVTLRKAIEDNYHAIPVERKDFDGDLTEARFNEIVKMIAASIEEAGIEARESKGVLFYDIPVGDFKDWIADSDFYQYDVTILKQTLSKRNLIYTNQGRFDHNVRMKEGSKVIKCVSFYKRELEEFLAALPKKPV